METEDAINAKIMKLTMVIQENYPELSQFLNEMPVTVPIHATPEINSQNLQKYYETLLNLFRKYVAEHQLNYISQKSKSGNL
jgi:TorA maturation chaperone TorD